MDGSGQPMRIRARKVAAMTSELPPKGGIPGDVELTIPAATERLTTISAVAADLGLRADMTLDDLADLRLAVAEACAALISVAKAGERMHCAFWVTHDHLELLARVRTHRRTSGDADGFGRHVLDTLADLVEWTVEPGMGWNTDQHVRIRLRKGL